MADQHEFRINARDMEPCVLFQRNEALEQFRQCVANGAWCEVWEGMAGVNSVTKIAEFPGLATAPIHGK